MPVALGELDRPIQLIRQISHSTGRLPALRYEVARGQVAQYREIPGTSLISGGKYLRRSSTTSRLKALQFPSIKMNPFRFRQPGRYPLLIGHCDTFVYYQFSVSFCL